MAMIDLNLNPETRQLRQFGFIAFVAFGLIGALTLWKSGLFGFDFGAATRTVVGILWGLGLLSGALSLVFPRGNRPLYVILTLVSYPIGMVLSYVLMGIIFYLLLTPVGLLFRLIGRDALKRRFEPDAASYFVAHKPEKNPARYFRQF